MPTLQAVDLPREVAETRHHHEGSIFRRKRDGKWTAAVSMPDGRRREKACRWYDNNRDAAGVPRVSPHGLRHTSLTLLADAGVPEDVRQRRAGHSTTAMARHYVHGAEQADRRAADELGKAIGR